VPETIYILAVLTITFGITFALRAVPFAVLGTLKESNLVQDLSRWMPVGVWASWW
jgi:branched-subunit amino acid transport protein AzlD